MKMKLANGHVPSFSDISVDQLASVACMGR